MPPTLNTMPQSSISTGSSMYSRLDAIARWIMVAVFSLIPFFFAPVTWLTSLQSKMLLVSVLLALTAILWVVARVLEGGVKLPWNMVIGSAALLPIVYAISTVANGFSSVSLVGTGVEADTLAVVALQFAAFALTAMLFLGEMRYVIRTVRGFFLGVLALELIHIVHVIMPSLSLGGVLGGETGNALGTWHEFTILIGLSLVMAITLMRSSVAAGWWKFVLLVVGILALPILVISNFADVWIAVGIASLILVVVRWRQSGASLSIGYAKNEWVTLALIVLAGLSVFFGARVVSYLPERISVVQVEVRPSWQGTYQIGEQSLSNPKALMVGVGPNTFVREWGLYKPVEVNQTPFWNADFNVGVAPIPTSFISLGIIGVIAWLATIIATVWTVLSLWIRRREAALSSVILAISIAVVYLLGFHLSSVPGTSLGLVMFLSLGLLVAAITPMYSRVRAVSVSGGDWKNATLLAATGLIALIALISSVGVLRAVVADALINRAISSYGASQNLQKSSDLISLSLVVSPRNDRAHRSAVELGLLKLQSIIAANDPDQEAARAQLQSTLETTIEHGLSAVAIDGRDYQNWLQLASLYSQLAGAQISGAYDNARAAYVRAQEENPTSPLPFLNLAQLDAIQGNFTSALENLGRAVQLKPDLAAAYYLASQIYVSQNDPANALQAAAETARFAPNDPLAWYNAGAIAYAAGSFQDASIATQQALALQPQYANAMYILGLSLYQLGEIQNSITVFEALDALDPGQEIVKQILTNLRAGEPLDTPVSASGE